MLVLPFEVRWAKLVEFPHHTKEVEGALLQHFQV